MAYRHNETKSDVITIVAINDESLQIVIIAVAPARRRDAGNREELLAWLAAAALYVSRASRAICFYMTEMRRRCSMVTYTIPA